MDTEAMLYIFGPGLALIVGYAMMFLVMSYNAWKAK